MSASTIARWNAISMSRDSDANMKKRPRSNAEDEDVSSDDNVSIVSRSPSPVSDKDIQMDDSNLYDEHVRRPAREVITVETRIKSSNKGFALLAKMGWTEGTPLGVSGEGRVDPIPFSVKQDQTGLGKVTQDFRMIETTVSQRRNLDSERMQFETAAQRQQREATVAQKAQVQAEISSVLRPFYCELCDKQFKNVAQYDEHTNSYAHHHKARMKDMNANHPMKIGGKEEAERRKEKERKREEKEMRKLAKAAGIKLAPAPSVSASAVNPSGEQENNPSQKAGWASVSASSGPSSSAGWASVPSAPAAGSWSAPSNPAPSSTSRGSGWQTVGSSSHPSPAPPFESSSAPHTPPLSTGFRSGGWSSLASSTGDAAPPPPPSGGSWSTASPPPPPPPDSAPPPPPSSWSPEAPPRPPSPGGWRPLPPPSSASPLPPPPSNSWSRNPPVADYRSAAPSPPAHRPPHDNRAPPLPSTPLSHNNQEHHSNRPTDREKPVQTRGNWQQFQKMRGRR